ncbi:MAG: hypothetical protein WBL62_00505 [Gallionella sp.]
MSMIFCRGCGKSIHESAVSCPHCGATQAASVTSVTSAGNPSIWMAVTSLVLGILGLIIALGTDVWTKEDLGIEFIFSVLGIAFGVISLSKKMAGKGMAIAGVVLNSLSLLILLGSV